MLRSCHGTREPFSRQSGLLFFSALADFGQSRGSVRYGRQEAGKGLHRRMLEKRGDGKIAAERREELAMNLVHAEGIAADVEEIVLTARRIRPRR